MSDNLQDPTNLIVSEPGCWKARVFIDFTPNMDVYTKDARTRNEIISIAYDVAENMEPEWALSILEVKYIGDEEDPEPDLLFEIHPSGDNLKDKPSFHHSVKFLNAFLIQFSQELVVRGHKPIEGFAEISLMLKNDMSPMFDKLGMPIPPVIKEINRRKNDPNGDRDFGRDDEW